MLINLTNHPSPKWGEKQLEAARAFGEVRDIAFPAVSPDDGEDYISRLAQDYLEKIMDVAGNNRVTVHVMGEMNFTFRLVTMLKGDGITCVASTTRRKVVETPEGRLSVFEFVRFRKY